MTKFFFDDIQKTPLAIQQLDVLSYEMNIYLVRLTTQTGSSLVYNQDDNPKRFMNVTEVREAFSHCLVEKAYLVHESPYDEMINNPASSSQPMIMPFAMQTGLI